MTFPIVIYSPNYVDPTIYARYWRINITANNSSSFNRLQTLEFYQNFVAGTIDGTGGTAIASSSYDAGYGPDKLFDGNIATGWISATGASLPQWVGYDYGVGKAVNVNTVAITGNTGDPNGDPKDFQVQYSYEGTTWYTAWSVTGWTSWYDYQRRVTYDIRTTPVYADPKRKWAIFFNQVANGDGSLAEIQELRFNTAEGVSAPLSGVAISSSANGGSVAANAFDGSTGTFWTSAGNVIPGPEWVGYDWGAGVNYDITQVYITQAGGRSPKDFLVAYSGDGLRWNAAWTVTGVDYWPGAQKTFWKPNGPSDAKRMWRIYITNTSNGGFYPEIRQVQFLRTGDVEAPLKGLFLKSSQNGGDIVENAFDNSDATQWTAGSSCPQWAGYDFGQGEDIVKVTIKSASDTGRAPTDFTVDYSDDGGVSWITSWSVAGSTGWTANLTRTFAKP